MSVDHHVSAIKELEYAIFKNENMNKLIQIRKNKPFFLGQRKINVYSAIGHTFGSYFEIQSDGSLKKLTSVEEAKKKLSLIIDGENLTKDNRSLIDTGESQKLTTDDIEAYKKQGISGLDMVKIIVENSKSFQEKTAFSKEKYLRKKQKKYVNIIQMLRPNIRLLSEMYYSQGPLKICNLRIDSLSQMLAFCNVMSGGKYIILETVQGLLTAAVVERLGFIGCVVQMHLGSFSIHQPKEAVVALNYEVSDVLSVLYNIDFKNAMTLLGEEESEKMIIDSADNTDSDVPNKRQKTERGDHIQRAKDILAPRDIDSLLVAVKNHPSNVLPLLDFLAFSRPFAIFSMYQEPLVDCYVTLKARGDIISLNITETWFRRYQVLPERTHPCYSMSGNGGFLLTGIKVQPKPKNS